MTYQSKETSIEDGRPVEVYTFTVGAQQFFYTSAEDVVTIGSTNFTPRPISRENTREDPARRDADFVVRLPTSDDVAQTFVGQLPGVRVRLKVQRFHRSDTPTPEVVTVFDGFVNAARFEKQGRECVLVSRPVLASNGRTIPRRTYQGPCNHVLYDPLTCKVDDTDPAFRAANRTVTSQVGNVLTVSGISPAYPDGHFTGGYVEAIGQNDFRLILSHVGSTLTLLLPFAQVPPLVNVFAGCAHDVDTCSVKFDNVLNYGGFPFVPTKNPFQTGIT